MVVSPSREAFVTANNLALHYVQWGERGTPIIFVHGLTANAFCFQAFADTFSSDYRVMAYDLRGRGDSAKPEQGYSVPTHAADLASLIDALGLERPHIVGHSLGALVALYFAAHYPEKMRKLVLIDAGAPLPWATPEEQPVWLTSAINRLGTTVPSFEAYIALLKQAPFLGPYWNTYVDAYFEHDVYRRPDGSVVSKASRDAVIEEGANYHQAEPEQQWRNVHCPTLLLRAGQGLFFDDDQLLSEQAAAAVQQGIANCQYVNYPTLNHYTICFATEPGPTQAIQRFLQAS